MAWRWFPAVMKTTPPPTAAELRKLSVEFDADPRTIRKILKGQTVRGVTGERLHRELQARGYLPAPQQGKS